MPEHNVKPTRRMRADVWVSKTSHVYPVEFANANIQQGLKLEHYSSATRLYGETLFNHNPKLKTLNSKLKLSRFIYKYQILHFVKNFFGR